MRVGGGCKKRTTLRRGGGAPSTASHPHPAPTTDPPAVTRPRPGSQCGCRAGGCGRFCTRRGRGALALSNASSASNASAYQVTGGGAANNTNPGVLVAGQLLTEGFIALQAETAPIDFRTVEIVNLSGCMNPKDVNYKAYYVKSDPSACRKK